MGYNKATIQGKMWLWSEEENDLTGKEEEEVSFRGGDSLRTKRLVMQKLKRIQKLENKLKKVIKNIVIALLTVLKRQNVRVSFNTNK